VYDRLPLEGNTEGAQVLHSSFSWQIKVGVFMQASWVLQQAIFQQAMVW
jgi:hypothetical protein